MTEVDLVVGRHVTARTSMSCLCHGWRLPLGVGSVGLVPLTVNLMPENLEGAGSREPVSLKGRIENLRRRRCWKYQWSPMSQGRACGLIWVEYDSGRENGVQLGARSDLLGAARALTQRGLVSFSPADLIAEARRQGSSYPESTLRTFIGGPMCSNSPNHHAAQYNDLLRVSHGQYRLIEGIDVEQRTPVPATNPPIHEAATATESNLAKAEGEWFWEGNVQATVVHHLASAGWTIRRVADTASGEHGVDIHAVRSGEALLIEVKGYPSTVYVRGSKVGQAKATHPALQARLYFSHALLSGLIMRAENANARIALAFPGVTTYSTLIERTWKPLRDCRIELWQVTQDGLVIESGGSVDGASLPEPCDP